MSDLDQKIKKFKELSKKSKIPKKRSKVGIFVTIFLISLLFIQAANVYANYINN